VLQQLVNLEADRAQRQEQTTNHMLQLLNTIDKRQDTIFSVCDAIKTQNHEMMKNQSRRSDQLSLPVHRPHTYAPRLDQPSMPVNAQYRHGVRPDQSSAQGNVQ
jgi:hypothetical protein